MRTQARVEATTDGKRILVRFPYDAGLVARVKKVPGARWKPDDKVWSFPLAMSTAIGLREQFGDSLTITPALAQWGWDERRRAEELETIRAGGAADLPRVRAEAPALWAALQTRPYQIAGAAFIAKGKRVCLGDEPRLGKTYQALAAVTEAGSQRVLIACPRTAARTVWFRKIAELTARMGAFVAQGSRADREDVIQTFANVPGPKALIVNLEMMRVKRRYQCQTPEKTERTSKPGMANGCQASHEHKNVYYPEYPQLFEVPWDAVILDESHHALASTYNKQSGNITQIRLGAVRLPIADDGIALAMSGTPFRSRVKKSWGTLNWLRPDAFSSFWRFAEEMFTVEQNRYGKTVSDTLRDEDRFRDALRPYYLARTKAEVAPFLPPITYAGGPPAGNPDGPRGVYVEMAPEQAKAYADMARMAAADLATGRVTANGVLAELTRLRQLACCPGRVSPTGEYYPALPSGKFDWLADFLEERRELSGKVVIASQFTRLVDLFAAEVSRMGWEVLTLTGGSTDAQREHAQDRFQNGSPRVIVINMFAGGEAIDLSAADEMVILDEPWVTDVITQVENRIQNLAKRNQLTIYRLRSEGTVEEGIAALTDEQKRILASARPEAAKLAAELVAAL